MFFKPFVTFFVLSAVILQADLSCAAGAFPVPKGSQSVATVAPAQAVSLEDALTAVSRQANVAFVVEGVPRMARPGDAPAGGTAPPATDSAPLLTIVTGIADAHDYRVTRLGNVFVLNKRFSRRDEIPEVTIEEAQQAVRDMSRCFARFAPRLGSPWNDTQLKQLLDSLPQPQQDLLRGNGLPVASLTTDQKTILQRQALHTFLDYGVQDMEGLLTRFDAVNDKNARIALENDTLGIRIAHTPGDSRLGFLPLQGGTEWAIFSRGTTAVNLTDMLPRSNTDKATPPPAASKAGRPVPLPRTVVTLEAAAARLTKRQASVETVVPAVTVDAMLASKRVLLIGDERVASPEVVRALAQVYGLSERREIVDGHEQVRLTRYSLRMPRYPSEVNAEVRRLLPAPFIAFLSAGQPEEKSPLARVPREKYLVFEARALAVALTKLAAYELEQGVGPKVLQSPDRNIPVSKLEPGERMALASLLMGRGLERLGRFALDKSPWFVTDLNQGVIQSSVETREGKQMWNFRMGRLLPSGGASWTGPMWSGVLR